MLGELNTRQIEDILYSQSIGRLGCHADGVTYVVPVTYAYDGRYVYAHTAKGMKVNMMRKNPEVCFEVESVSNMSDWQSVISWGKYEEITGEAARKMAMQKLIDHLLPVLTGETVQPSHGFDPHMTDAAGREVILFRIKLNNKTGRFEKQNEAGKKEIKELRS
jgi:hypothetical protein